MQLIIDISDMYVEVLSKWASVSRTMSESQRLLCESLEDESLSDPQRDDICANIRELRDLEPAINALHKAAQTAIWQKQRGES